MKTVLYATCPCGKRGFEDERVAEKALGKAQAKRRRQWDKVGTRRGGKMENRYYECDIDGGLFHLTSQSRREFASNQGDGELAPVWDMSQFRIGQQVPA